MTNDKRGPFTLEQASALPQHAGRPMTDEEIRADIANDPDLAPEMSAADFAAATLVAPAGKVALSLRIDADVVAAYKATGKGWQTRMNEVLRGGVATDGDAATQLREMARALEHMASQAASQRSGAPTQYERAVGRGIRKRNG